MSTRTSSDMNAESKEMDKMEASERNYADTTSAEKLEKKEETKGKDHI